jgi:hypothetical protein
MDSALSPLSNSLCITHWENYRSQTLPTNSTDEPLKMPRGPKGEKRPADVIRRRRPMAVPAPCRGGWHWHSELLRFALPRSRRPDDHRDGVGNAPGMIGGWRWPRHSATAQKCVEKNACASFTVTAHREAQTANSTRKSAGFFWAGPR